MIVDDFDLGAVTVTPYKTNAPLIVYPDAVLARTLALQCLQTIRWWNSQIVESLGRVEHPQLPAGHGLDLIRNAPRPVTVPDAFGFLVSEAPDHCGCSITLSVM